MFHNNLFSADTRDQALKSTSHLVQDFLLTIAESSIDFDDLCETLERFLPTSYSISSATQINTFVRVLILQEMFNLNDEQLETQMIYRASFQNFIQLKSNEPIPSRTSILQFKTTLSESGIRELFEAALQQALEHRPSVFLSQERPLQNSVDLNKVLAGTPMACQILSGQIDDVSQNTERAAENIIMQIGQIENAVSELSQTIEHSIISINSIKSSGSDQIYRVNESIELMDNYINNRKTSLNEHSKKISDVLKKTNQLSTLTDSVKDISSQTNLLALNAAIVAASTGNAGSGFKVIAAEIRTLSNDSKKSAQQIGFGIRELAESIVSNMESVLGEESVRKEVEQLEYFANQTKNISSIYERYDLLNSEILCSLNENSKYITEMVIETLGSLQFQDITRQQLEQVQEGILHIENHLKNISSCQNNIDSLRKIRPLEIDNMMSEYNMNSQRQVHARLSGNNETELEAALPSIQLF